MISAELQSKFDSANNIVFMTGAGISTPSGIPDYRSKNGLYTNDKSDKPAEYYLSSECLNREPEVFYDYMMKNMYYPDAKPNVIHEKQAAFSKQKNATIITQNIDGLYQKAGATNLVEFHGTLFDVYCQKCGQHVDYHDYLKSMTHEGCGGVLRPNIVLYGEGLDANAISQSVTAMSNADLVVIVGTSMRVYPFAGLIDYRANDAEVVAINQEQLSFPFPFTMITDDAVNLFESLQVN
ncbi:NAD-dependent protein deacylase [Lentilactobacillus sp. Marseille-Q4993]|uniref:NAD-dependent protein deacylase n=1 Tax=Lentilactobacillus sp. Marseille-Q4993 TaxID=3039492 RepID=UPI0024BD49B2|nr:NAD-dependent protein deacylase [Lentilactobacillus sp. Marseille-Q4993]